MSLRLFGTPGGIRTHGLSLRRRPLYPAELRDLVLESPYFQGFRGIGDCSPWILRGVFANQEGRFLISFSNFGGRTFSPPADFDLRFRGVGVIGIPGHFRTQFPLSASGKPAVGLFLRRRTLYPAELRAHARCIIAHPAQ